MATEPQVDPAREGARILTICNACRYCEGFCPVFPAMENRLTFAKGDLAYLAKDQAETSVLFELIGARYERRSLLITANQPFSEWGKIFPDPSMTLAAIDRLVHHATILEMNVDSYRRKEAIDKARGVGRPSTRATIKASS